jgi:DNA-binding CsgD family transcriptional regulator
MTKEKSILYLYDKGKDIESICGLLKVSKPQVYYYLRKNNKYNKKHLTPGLEKEIIFLGKKGKSVRYISKEKGIDKNLVCKLLNSIDVSKEKMELILMLNKKGYSPFKIAEKLTLTTKKVKEILCFNAGHSVLKKVGLTVSEVKKIRKKLKV